MQLMSQRGRRQRGAAAVEMAIMLPLLLLVIGGIVDFGRFFLSDIQLANAAREGARVAVIGQDAAAIDARVRTAAKQVEDTAGLDVVIVECAGAGSDATVTASEPGFDWILFGPAMSFFGGSPTTLPNATSTAVMRCEA